MNNGKNKIKELYLSQANNIFLTAGINLIPYIGGALEEIIFSKARKQKEENFKKLIKDIEKSCKVLNDSKIDRDYLKSEEYISLVEKIIINAIRESREEKRKMYSIFIKNSSIKEFKGFNKELLLDLLIRLDFFFLQLLKDALLTLRNLNSGINVYSLIKIRGLGENIKDMEDYLFYLSSLGLLRVDKTAEGSVEDFENVDVEIFNSFYFTKLGKELLAFIN